MLPPAALAADQDSQAMQHEHMGMSHDHQAMDHENMGMGHDQQAMDHSMHQMPTQKATVRTVATYDVPDVTLKGMNGEKVPLRAELAKGPAMVNFIFTSCTTMSGIERRHFLAGSGDAWAGGR